jgi:hypothetical protein
MIWMDVDFAENARIFIANIVIEAWKVITVIMKHM